MQKEENELDQYLRSKIEEADFEFKEAYWQSALKMLDENEETKKRPIYWRWLSIFGTLLFLGVGAIILVNTNHKKISKNKKVTLTQNANGQSDIQDAKSFTVDQPKQTSGDNTLNQTEDNNEIKATVKEEKPINKPTISESNPDETSPTFPVKKADQKEVAGNTKNEKTESVAENRKETYSKSYLKEQKKRQEKEAKKAARDLKKEMLALEKQQKQIDRSALAPAEENPIILKGKKMQPVDTQTYMQRVVRDESIYNPRYNASLKNYETERLDSITVFTFKPLQSKPTEVIKQEVVRDSVSKQNASLRFFLLAAANFNKGFKGNVSNAKAWGVSPLLSVGVEKKVNSKISLASQIGFTYFNALNVQKKVVSYKYSFGYDSTQTIVSYQRMYQLVLPISMAYQVHQLHSVWASVGASYVLNIGNKVSENDISKNQSGYTEGIKKLDVFGQIGYQYQINQKFNLQAMLLKGFLNTTEKSYFNTSNQNTQSRLLIGLKYYFKRNGN